MLQSDYLGQVFERVADRLRLDTAQVQFTLDDPSTEDDAVESLTSKLTVAEAGLSVAKVVHVRHTSSSLASAPEDQDTIVVRLQGKGDKVPVESKVKSYEPLAGALRAYALAKRLSVNSLRLEFDGERIDGKSSPQNLDIEDGDVIDILIQ